MLCNDLSDLYAKLSRGGVWINRAFLGAGYYEDPEKIIVINRWYGDVNKKLLLLPTCSKLRNKLTVWGCRMLILDPSKWALSTRVEPYTKLDLETLSKGGYGYPDSEPVRNFNDYISYLDGKGKLDKSYRTVKEITSKLPALGIKSMKFVGYTEEEIYTTLGGPEAGSCVKSSTGDFDATVEANAGRLLRRFVRDPKKEMVVVFSKIPLKASVKKTVSCTIPVSHKSTKFEYAQLLGGRLLMIHFPDLINITSGGFMLGLGLDTLGYKMELE